jgi:uncharacterized protein GlcG (DUF336 family)
MIVFISSPFSSVIVFIFSQLGQAYYSHALNLPLYTCEPSFLPMNTITILAISVILTGAAILSITGFSIISSVVAQTTGDNSATVPGNMTAGVITLNDAREIISAAEKKATEIGQPQNIAVVDAGGNLVSHVRMDGAWIGSIDVSINKAFTSRAFDISTKDLGNQSQPGGQFFGINESNDGRIMIFAGGIPLVRNGQVVRAIGVSGGSGDQDHTVAEAGAAAFSRN